MANNNLDISLFNAAGVYVVENEVSIPTLPVNNQRAKLVVGFSRKGPKNTVVYLESKSDAINVFGDIDSYLEKRGSYFHRSLLTALESGPVFALNLFPANNDEANGDKVEYLPFSLDMAATNAKAANGEPFKYLYSGFFNKERFWKPDEDYFSSILELNPVTASKYFGIANLSDKPVSILVRKASNVPKDFRITVSEFYGSGNEPAIAKPFDLVSDYFIEVVVVEGKWNDYANLAADPIYGKYFDTAGLKKERLNDFLASGVKVLASYTGAVLPELLDNQGANYSIDALINKDFLFTGIFCLLNDKAIEDYDSEIADEGIDLVGHNLLNGKISSVNFLSYNNIVDKLAIAKKEADRFMVTASSNVNASTADLKYSIDGYTENNLGSFSLLQIDEASIEVDVMPAGFNDNDNAYVLLGGNKWLYGTVNGSAINGMLYSTDNLIFKDENKHKEALFLASYSGAEHAVTFNLNDVADELGEDLTSWYTAIDDTNVYVLENNTLVKATCSINKIDNGGGNYTITINGLTASSPITADAKVVFNPFIAADDISMYKGRKELNILAGTPNKLIIGKENESYSQISSFVYQSHTVGIPYTTTQLFAINDAGKEYSLVVEWEEDGTIVISDDNALAAQGAELAFDANDEIKIDYIEGENIFKRVPATATANPNAVTLAEADAAAISVGDYVAATYNDEKVLSTVIDKVARENGGTITYEITTLLPITIEDGQITKVYKIDDYVSHYNIHTLSGLNIGAYHLPNGTDDQMEKIYGMLDETNSNMMEVLADKNIISWRYIVDTFSGGIKPNMGGKVYLSRLAKKRGQGLALLNMPQIKELVNSTNPYFTTKPSPTNPKPIFDSKYLVSGGNLELGPTNKFTLPTEENGGKYCGVFGPWLTIIENGKKKLVPPAADISNNFVRKFRNGQPYAIIANEPNGVINNALVVGTEYDLLDSDRANFEAIGINPIVSRNGNVMVFANLTAYQRVVTPLNSLHVRDLLISIENALLNITSKYLFKKNTETLRFEIRTLVETYLEGVITDGGIVSYNVKMDSSNNTEEIISQRMAILDVEITPALGMEKFVTRITVYGNGGSTSTGF